MVEPLGGAEAVLAGTGLSKSNRDALVAAWRPLSGHGIDAQMKVLRAFVGDGSFDWPWFDDCMARFERIGLYPDVAGWDLFAPDEPEPEPTTPDEALNWVDLADARALLREFGVIPVGRKHSDIYSALFAQVPHERWVPLGVAAWRSSRAEIAAGPDRDAVGRAKTVMLAASMSAADYVAHRLEQLRAMVDDGSMSGIRSEPDDAIAQAMMNDPSPFAPHRGLPPFFPGDRSGIAGVRATQRAAPKPAPAPAADVAPSVARGIAEEKTRESVAVFQVIGAVLLAWVVGAVADSMAVGVGLMLLLFIPIWKSYRR